jgi:AcrR family transcriptional regulator
MNAQKKAVGRPATVPTPPETILAHASRLFADNGYERTSLQDVSRSVGLSKAAVYHYFPTKQDIYEAIVADLLEGLYDHVRSSIEAENDHAAKLKRFMVAHAQFFEQHHSEFITLLHGVSGIGTKHTDRQRGMRDRYEALLRKLLSDGNAAGAFNGVDAAVTALAILSMLNWMSRWFDPKGSRRATQFAADYFDICYRGLAPQ